MDFSKLTKKSQQAFINSKELLNTLDHAAIEPEHLMASMCLLDDISKTQFLPRFFLIIRLMFMILMISLSLT